MNQQVITKFAKVRAPLRACRSAFTLIELLVVIAIIGLLTTIGLPAIRGMTKSNALAAADRQLLDDIGLARQLALANHTSVYIVFVPPNISTMPIPVTPGDPNYVVTHNVMTNLYSGQYTTYSLLSLRSVGDQPGQPYARYLTPWKTLPAGTYIATNKFVLNASIPNPVATFFYNNSATPEFPFPLATNTATAFLPHFGFDYSGRLIYRSNSVDNLVFNQAGGVNQLYMPLARGSIFYTDDGTGTGGLLADVSEAHQGDAYYPFDATNITSMANNQPLDNGSYYNQIYIDPLSGKARVQKLDVQ